MMFTDADMIILKVKPRHNDQIGDALVQVWHQVSPNASITWDDGVQDLVIRDPDVPADTTLNRLFPELDAWLKPHIIVRSIKWPVPA